MFPVITQTVTIYSDFLTKEKYVFVSYTKHMLGQDHINKSVVGTETKLDGDDEDINVDNLNLNLAKCG